MKKLANSKIIALSALIIAIIALSGCSSAAPSQPVDPASVQLSWTHDYSEAPFYAAEMNKHFAEQNLKVLLEEGGFGANGYIEPIDEVVSGKVDFGLSSASTLIQARADGKPVVAFMSILQRSPFVLISLDKSHITQPKDLVGKKVSVSAGGAKDIYLSFLKSQGIDPATVNTLDRKDFGVDPLLKGDVDVLAGWLINEGVMVAEAGQKANFILPSEYGIESYDFLVFTTQDVLKNHPDKVEHFARAISGFQDD